MVARFPSVPPNPFWSSDEAVAIEVLSHADAFVAGLAARPWAESLSPRLAEVFGELVGTSDGTSFASLPYRLVRYPDRSKRRGSPGEQLRDVLLWRAGVVDFLSDAWDTLGDAGFEVGECQRLAALLTPEGKEGNEYCPLCLGPQTKAHYDACAVQRAWRGEDAGPLAS